MKQPSKQDVQQALDRILASRAFQGSERMSRFLRFSVQHTLEGDQSPLKEYLIADRVFDRGQDFDPRTDTIVRVEARRLRSKLKEYYQEEGRNDPILIELADRGYTPSFRLAEIPTSKPRLNRRVLAIGIVFSGIVLAGVWWMMRPRPVVADSIVVLPCANVNGDPENDALADGFTEELIGALGTVPSLHVVARTSAFQYRGRSADVREVGRNLGVKMVFECGVRREGQRIRVTAQLVTAADGFHLWSEVFDREFASAIAIQTEIARSIVDALKIRMASTTAPGLSSAHTANPEAHELYLKGRYFWYKGTPADLRKSIDYMERAIAVDPKYAAAYSGLADAYSLWSGFGLEPPGESRRKGKRAAQTAVQLDDTSADAHFGMGVALSGEVDWPGAEREFQRALGLNPSLVAARQAYAVLCLAPLRRYEEAVGQLRQAVALDP